MPIDSTAARNRILLMLTLSLLAAPLVAVTTFAVPTQADPEGSPRGSSLQALAAADATLFRAAKHHEVESFHAEIEHAIAYGEYHAAIAGAIRQEDAARREAERQAAEREAAERARARRTAVTTTTTPPAPVQAAPVASVGSCAGLEGVIAAYFPADQVPRACRVMMCESGGNPHAANPRSSASGLFQFLDGTWVSTTGTPAPASAYSVETQVAAAATLWRSSGWSPWVCR